MPFPTPEPRQGHELCVSREQFQRLQELYDNQKKIIGRLQEEVAKLREMLIEMENSARDIKGL